MRLNRNQSCYYYYSTEETAVKGPFSTDALEDMLRTGVVHSDTQICAEGEERWIPLSQLKVIGASECISNPVESITSGRPLSTGVNAAIIAGAVSHSLVKRAGKQIIEEFRDLSEFLWYFALVLFLVTMPVVLIVWLFLDRL